MNPLELATIQKEWYEKIVPLISNEEDIFFSLDLRIKLIDKFINKNHMYFETYFSPNSPSHYYLWDMIKPEFAGTALQTDIQELQKIRLPSQQVYLQWEFDPLPIGSERLISLPFSALMSHLENFPKDLYIFDKSLDWLLIQTHEELNMKGDHWLLIDPNNYIGTGNL